MACDGLKTTHTAAGVKGRKIERKGGGRHTGHLVYIYGKGLEHRAEGKYGP